MDCASVDGFRERGRGMLGTGRLGCFEALESFGDVAGHGELDGTLGVVPIEGDTAIKLAFPVGCHLVFGGDDAGEVLGVFSANILDAEVIDDERK